MRLGRKKMFNFKVYFPWFDAIPSNFNWRHCQDNGSSIDPGRKNCKASKQLYSFSSACKFLKFVFKTKQLMKLFIKWLNGTLISPTQWGYIVRHEIMSFIKRNISSAFFSFYSVVENRFIQQQGRGIRLLRAKTGCSRISLFADGEC